MNVASAQSLPRQRPPNKIALEPEAISGDSDAAQILSNHYAAKADLQTAEGWSILAAEDGGAKGEYGLAHYLLDKPDTDSQVRAVFWMEMALKTADPSLAKYIREVLVSKTLLTSPTGDACVFPKLATLPPVQTVYLDQNHTIFRSQAGQFDFQDLVQLRLLALCGEIRAARVLIAYYSNGGAAGQTLYFTTIAAENGDAAAELMQAQTLAQSQSDQQAQQRALFWAKRALATATDPKLQQQTAAFISERRLTSSN